MVAFYTLLQECRRLDNNCIRNKQIIYYNRVRRDIRMNHVNYIRYFKTIQTLFVLKRNKSKNVIIYCYERKF